MSEVIPLVPGSIVLFFILFSVHLVFRYFQSRNGSFIDKISSIFKELSIWNVLFFIISGFAIIGGINFIFLPDYFQPFPQNLQIQETDVIMLILGGIIIIAASIHSFKSDLIQEKNFIPIGKNRISLQFLEFCKTYSIYKTLTNNPELQVLKFIEDNTIIVDTPDGNDFISSILHFNLFYMMDADIVGPISSLEIAECYLKQRTEKNAYFKISKWIKSDSNQEIIAKLKNNQSFDSLKPFIKLKNNPIADKCNYSELDNFIKTLSKFRDIMEEEERNHD